MQIMSLPLMTIMPRFTTRPPKGLFDGSWKDIMEQFLHMV